MWAAQSLTSTLFCLINKTGTLRSIAELRAFDGIFSNHIVNESNIQQNLILLSEPCKSKIKSSEILRSGSKYVAVEVWCSMLCVFKDEVTICWSLKWSEHVCTALPRVEFVIEPPPDTQRERRRGERGMRVTKGSYLLLNNLPLPSPSPPPYTLRACCVAWGCVIRTYPPPSHSTFPWTEISDFQEKQLKSMIASF